jgi:glyoxalase family protein
MALDAGEDLAGWREHAAAGPVPVTPVYDHYFFDSAYAPTPGGLIELCSHGPGFTLDQRLEDLGEGAVSLSPWTEPLRAKLERDLTPIVNPRSRRAAMVKRARTPGTPADPDTGRDSVAARA